jgi:hypothetical protein
MYDISRIVEFLNIIYLKFQYIIDISNNAYLKAERYSHELHMDGI